MQIRRLHNGIVPAAAILLAAGSCVSTGPSPLTYSVQSVSDGRDSAMDAAEIALTELGFAIARRDLRTGTLVSAPSEPTEGDLREAHARRISSDTPVRRIAEVRVEGAAEGTQVFCKVSVQKQVTQSYRLFQAAHSATDAPGETAIDRDAAGTAAQITVWQTVSRDKVAERAILAAIAKRIDAQPH